MAKTNFVNGSVVTSDFLNSINNIIFDGQEFDGHHPKIANTDLSEEPGQIKPEWTTFRDTLSVSAGTGLSASYVGGTVVLPSGAIATIAPATISLTNNATNYVYVDSTGAVVVSTSRPLLALMLAQITCVSGVISGSIIDLRPRFQVMPRQDAVRYFGGSGGDGDYVLTGTATFDQGEYYFRSLTIQAGAVLTIASGAYIRVARNVVIAGTVNVTAGIAGGAGFGSNVVGTIGALSGGGPGAGSGSGGGPSYNYILARHGSGGGSGLLSLGASSTGTIAPGGKGGGGLTIEAGGTITVTGTINARGGNGSNGQITSGTGSSSGSGAGSGGLVLLSSLIGVTVSSVATIDVRGGTGGNGTGTNGQGGGAGGGGQVVLISPSNNTSGATILLSPGSDGSDAGTGLGGGAGGGFGGSGGVRATSNVAATSGQLILRNFVPVG